MPMLPLVPQESENAGRIFSSILAYGFALGAVVLATILRLLLTPLIGPGTSPFLTYFLANALVMRYTGVGPSLFAILTGAAAADWFITPPLYTFGTSPTDLLTEAIFIVANLLILGLAQSMRRAKAQADANSRAARERTALLNLAPVLGRNLDDTIFMWGRGAEVLYGFSAAEALGRVTHDLLKTKFPAPLQTIRAQVLSEGKWEGELVEQRKDGSWLTALSQWVLLRNENGQPVAILETCRDITRRKQAEAALEEARHSLEKTVQERTAKLREMVTELERFSYAITHDMRAPLRAMQCFGNMLLKECADSLQAQHKDLLRRIATSARRMDALIADALQYHKAIREEYELAPVDAAKLLGGMLESYPDFQPPLAEITVAQNMPLVLGNEAVLTQCFSNLLGNAVKFVEPGKTPRVSVWAEVMQARDVEPDTRDQKPAYVRLWFEDNGVGIAREHQERIWVMFERLHTNSESTGIGLALVRKLVERMKGKVGVQSEPGKGSRFWLDLQKAEN